VGDSVRETADGAVIRELLEIIESYIAFNTNHRSSKIQNSDDWGIGELILKLPLEFAFINSHYNFIRKRCLDDKFLSVTSEILERFYPRVLESKNVTVAQQTIRLLFDYKILEVGFRSVESKIQNFYLEDFVSKFAVKSFELLGLKLFRLLFNLIEQIDFEDNYSFSSMYINSIVSDSKDGYSDQFPNLVIEFIKSGINTLNEEDAYNTILLLSYYNSSIFMRLSLYLIGLNIQQDRVKKSLWSLENPINLPEARSEFRFVVSKLSAPLSSEEQKVYSGWIDSIELFQYKEELPGDYKDRLDLLKEEWRVAIGAEFNDDEGYDSRGVNFQSVEIIPSKTKRIINSNIEEIIPIFVSRKVWGGYNQQGLIGDVRQLPLETRQKLLASQESINFLPEVLWALIISHEINEGIDWLPFFSLIEKLLGQERMWDFSKMPSNENHPRADRFSNYSMDFWKAVCFSIRQAASKRQENYLSISDCRRSISVLTLIEPKFIEEFKVLNKGQEYIDAINSLRGGVYDALIEIAVSMAVQKESKEFEEEISRFLQSVLLRDQVSEELLWVIGGNLPKIGYMEIEWIERNRVHLFERANLGNLSTLKAYLLHANKVYKDLYAILHPYYVFAVKHFQEQSNYTGKLIQHICIANHSNWDKSEELVNEVFRIANLVHIEEIIKYYGQRTKRQRSSDESNTHVVLSLWQRILDFLSSSQTGKKEELAFNLIKWMQNFDHMEEELIDVINQTIELVNSYPFDYTVINYLKERVEIDPANISQILDRGLSCSNGFDFTGYESINEITAKLYEMSYTLEADRIVQHLVKRNIFFLVDQYVKYHTDPIL
jgi:hypothetical protein